MSLGERAAVTGLLSELRPELAIEIGVGGGGSLEMVTRLCREVHAFDLEPPANLGFDASNTVFHAGDSHVLLPEVLAKLAEQGRNVDFVLVDGDHSAEGVRQDLEDLLGSPALTRTVMLVHDVLNPEVRAGVDRVDFFAYEKVRYVDLDFVPGYVAVTGPFAGQQWGGLALVLLAPPTDPTPSHLQGQQRHFASMFEIVQRGAPPARPGSDSS